MYIILNSIIQIRLKIYHASVVSFSLDFFFLWKNENYQIKLNGVSNSISSSIKENILLPGCSFVKTEDYPLKYLDQACYPADPLVKRLAPRERPEPESLVATDKIC